MAEANGEPHAIQVRLDELLAEHGMTLTEPAYRVGVTRVNLSILKNGRAKAIRTTLTTSTGCWSASRETYSASAQTTTSSPNRAVLPCGVRGRFIPGRSVWFGSRQEMVFSLVMRRAMRSVMARWITASERV